MARETARVGVDRVRGCAMRVDPPPRRLIWTFKFQISYTTIVLRAVCETDGLESDKLQAAENGENSI